MSVSTISSLVVSGESQILEWKESVSDSKDISVTITAFANTDGGTLILGVSKQGEMKGLSKNLDEVQQKISSCIQNISPRPNVSVEVVNNDEKSFILLQIPPSSDHVYFTCKGAIYVRVRSTNSRLDGTAQLEFLRIRQFLPFDDSVNNEASIADISLEKVRAFLERRGQSDYLSTNSIEHFLISQRLARFGNPIGIKNVALVLFAKNPTYFFPQIELKLVKFIGEEAVVIAAHRLLQTDLITSINEAEQFIKDHCEKSIEVGDALIRKETFEYPISAIREVLVNAVAHRDYFSHDSIQISIFSNRLEIISPGGLPRGMTMDDFGLISIRRNPIIYQLLRDVGYVEGMGTGIPRIKNEVRRAGLVDPIFMSHQLFFRVTFYNRKGSKKAIEKYEDLNQRQKNALEYLQDNLSIKAAIYAELNQISYPTAVNDINEMVSYGYLVKKGTYRGACYVRA